MKYILLKTIFFICVSIAGAFFHFFAMDLIFSYFGWDMPPTWAVYMFILFLLFRSEEKLIKKMEKHHIPNIIYLWKR